MYLKINKDFWKNSSVLKEIIIDELLDRDFQRKVSHEAYGKKWEEKNKQNEQWITCRHMQKLFQI